MGGLGLKRNPQINHFSVVKRSVFKYRLESFQYAFLRPPCYRVRAGEPSQILRFPPRVRVRVAFTAPMRVTPARISSVRHTPAGISISFCAALGSCKECGKEITRADSPRVG